MAPRAKKPTGQPPVPPPSLRFEATIHPGERDVALSRVADLDLDRVPDPEGSVRVLVSPDELAELVERGYEVRLHRLAPTTALPAALVADDDAVVTWLEERVAGIPREEGS